MIIWYMYPLWNEIYENIIYTISYTQIYKEHINRFQSCRILSGWEGCSPNKRGLQRDEKGQNESNAEWYQ